MRAEEYETVILYNKLDKVWQAGTNIPEHQRLFEKKGWKHTTTLGDDKGYEAPRNAITFRDLTKTGRVMTEEQKERARQHMRKLQARKEAKTQAI